MWILDCQLFLLLNDYPCAVNTREADQSLLVCTRISQRPEKDLALLHSYFAFLVLKGPPILYKHQAPQNQDVFIDYDKHSHTCVLCFVSTASLFP